MDKEVETQQRAGDDGARSTPGNPFDAYAPALVARRVEVSGVAKARLPLVQTITLGVLAGAFIAFGGLFFLLAVTDGGLAFGLRRIVGGIAFSLGLILVIVAGAELFTGNNLIVMAWADKLISSRQLLRNWFWVYLGNLTGSLAMVVLAYLSGLQDLGGGALGTTAEAVARAKVDLSPLEALLRGVLCNILVCLAVWMCFAAHSVSSKILAIVFPVSAFVALGLEHSVANMFLIPFGMLAAGGGDWVGLGPFLANLLPVTLGNVIGGGVLVALVYWLVYRRNGGGSSSSSSS